MANSATITLIASHDSNAGEASALEQPISQDSTDEDVDANEERFLSASPTELRELISQIPSGPTLLWQLGTWPRKKTHIDVQTIVGIARDIVRHASSRSFQARTKREKTLAAAVRRKRDQAMDYQWADGFAKQYVAQCNDARKHGYSALWSWAAAATLQDVIVPQGIFDAVCQRDQVPDFGVMWAQGQMGRW